MGRRLDQLKARLGRHSPLKLAIIAVLIGVVVGAVGLVGAQVGLAATSTEAFCTSCHEMRDNVYAESKGLVHDTNRTGVRATCADCHVPHEIGPKLVVKIKASKEVWGKMTGIIDTKEKFEKHRYQMASNVWLNLKDTDSRECRNCHNRDAMSQEKQSEKAWSRHVKAKAEGKTCIECHFGIAHTEPDGPGPQELFAKQPAK